MSVTATKFRNNLGKYLLLSATEDIFITKNGKADKSLCKRLSVGNDESCTAR
ncbi:type II toxin-antitoxin system prevent-host-death family antitoxin [Lachnospiraceae bacterium 64-25]